MFVDVRNPHTGKLLFRFDAERDLIEVQDRGVKTLVDLSEYRRTSACERPGEPLQASERATPQ